MLPNNNNNCNLHELVQFLCTYHQQQPQTTNHNSTANDLQSATTTTTTVVVTLGIEIRNRQMALGILLQPLNLIPAIYDRHSTFSSATTRRAFSQHSKTRHMIKKIQVPFRLSARLSAVLGSVVVIVVSDGFPEPVLITIIISIYFVHNI